MFFSSIFFSIVYNNLIIPCYGYSDDVHGWNYLNVHCRDNENKPVEWWYMYKYPSEVVPYLEMGRSFTYITSNIAGRWQISDKYITSNSMLQHTLSPIYRPTYADHLAFAVYESHPMSDAFGVLMADEMGGVWIGHTVPGLVNINDDRPSFPDAEKTNGHLLMCLSVDLIAVNEIASAIRTAAPNFTYIEIPKRMKDMLPMWNFLKPPKSKKKDTKIFQLNTRGNSLPIEILTRPPGNKQCLYRSFAASKHIVLDVYGQTNSEYLRSVCAKDYSVRNIFDISLKLQETVLYVGNKTDRTKFAVSTAADWQLRGSSSPQYWTCRSNFDKEDMLAKGELLTCVNDYKIWLTFDNLKINEPEC